MKNNIIKSTLLFSVLFTAFSCNGFLDELPDNRATVDSREKIQKILVSAYVTENYSFITELSSDNIVDYGLDNPYSDRFQEQLAYWKDVTATDNDDPRSLWDGCYGSIANANEALYAINDLGADNYKAEKGEALIDRAYAHFILVNVFARQYNSKTSATDLGIVYMEKPESTLNPKYKRESVKAIYEKINRDIEEALPLLDDSYYEVPQYHFTKSAAYAFAARFNLFYEKWDKAEKYATLALGSTPSLRDWAAIGNLPRKPKVTANAYIDNPANLLAEPSTSSLGLVFGPYFVGSRFNHTRYLADTQTLFAPVPFAKNGVKPTGDFNYQPYIFSGNNFDKTLYIKIPALFQTTDAVAQTGYRKTVMIPFSTDETLLERAEAKILEKKYDEALSDINLWTGNFYKINTQVTKEQVDKFYDSIPYSTPSHLTSKKKLNPKFEISSGMQENLLHYVLQCKRVLTLHEGLRWFDLKRYGIEVDRVVYDNSGNPASVVVLPVDDPRRAIQLPQDVIGAGLEPNPRNN